MERPYSLVICCAQRGRKLKINWEKVTRANVSRLFEIVSFVKGRIAEIQKHNKIIGTWRCPVKAVSV